MQEDSPFRIPNSETIYQYNENIKNEKEQSRQSIIQISFKNYENK